MNYIDEIFTRADIQQIREFLLHGVEAITIDPRTYKERLDSSQRRMSAKLREEYPNSEAYEKITGLVYEYVNAVEAVYMEIGMQAGAKLAIQTAHSIIAALGRDAYNSSDKDCYIPKANKWGQPVCESGD